MPAQQPFGAKPENGQMVATVKKFEMHGQGLKNLGPAVGIKTRGLVL